jgi:ornithine--oxo-acid transaminase
MKATKSAIALEERWCARNYSPLPVVLARGEGVWLWDVEGRRYLDMLSAYSAVSHGHRHPRIVEALLAQAGQLDTVSRAFRSAPLGPFLARACELTGMDRALPMNTGAEAVETALKAARKWGYTVKGIAEDRAEIIVCDGNFHGRTLAITGLSSVPAYREGFGPFLPGIRHIPFGDAAALAAAIGPDTAAFLVEPIQGEGGIVVPPEGYLAECARLCRAANVLLICDEIQTGLGRTGRMLASEHEGVRPDGLCLGKALGGGLMPVSLFLARDDVMGVFRPGDHGSTFGGNPLAAAVGLAALEVLVEERLIACAAELGPYMMERLRALNSPSIVEVRGRGLLIGVALDPARAKAPDVARRLMDGGVLTNATHGNVVRFAPPLVIRRAELDLAVDALSAVLSGLEQ